MKAIDDMFRNVIVGWVSSITAMGSGMIAIFNALESVFGLIAVFAGILAAFFTIKAQIAAQKTEKLKQIEILGEMTKVSGSDPQKYKLSVKAKDKDED